MLIAGLEYVCYQDDSIGKIRKYVQELQQISRARVLLTSGLESQIWTTLDELPHIRYDEERKGLAISLILFANMVQV